MDLLRSYCRAAGTTFLLGIFVCSGCDSRSSEVQCASLAECSFGFICLDGRCQAVERTDQSEPGSRTDAGGIRFDAGSRALDAGSPRVDASAAPADTGTGSEDGDAGAVGGGGGSVCGPAACAVQGAQCGQVIDGCGAVVDCPACGSGYSCGTGAFANRCQCEPLSCSRLNAECGRITDNCGVTRDCSAETGGCRGPDQCSGNRCECQPRTCSGIECGNIDTGCGYMEYCGGCNGTERCGGPGVPENTCGCQTRTTATSWHVMRTARQIDASNGSADWGQLSKAQQDGGGGADFRISGVCNGSSGDRTCTTGRATSEHLQLTNSPVAIPRGARIRGVQVRIGVKKRDHGTTAFETVQLIGPRVSDNRADNPLPDTFRVDGFRNHFFGGDGDLWGRTWTPEEINASNFGLRLQMSATAACFVTGYCPEAKTDVDDVAIRVFYEICD